MATSKNAKMQFESGQTYHVYDEMVDSGDHTVYTITGGPIFSKVAGKEVMVRPNGIVTGRNIVSTHATDDTVTISAFTAYSIGVEQSVSATSLVITRPVSDVAKICSVTMTSVGAIAEVAGTDGATTTFSETFGAAGGPPEIPVDSVLIAQVRMTTTAAGVISADEIKQVVGVHTERFDFPTWKEYSIGDGDSATAVAKKYAYVEFDSALTLGHTGGLYKNVYAAYYSPIFAEISKAMNFVPAENTHSVSSTQYYNGTVGSVSSSLGQAKFTALMTDNITDTLIGLKDLILTFKFFSDRNKAPYILTQGITGLGRTFPVDGQNQAAVTISAEDPSADFAS